MPEDGAEGLNRPRPTRALLPNPLTQPLCSHAQPCSLLGQPVAPAESSIPVSDTSVQAGGYGGSALPSRGAPGCLPAL